MENPKKFAEIAMFPGNPHWEDAVKRENDLYSRGSKEIRSEFARDYTRVLHSNGYSRLKHKTQVFYNAAGNDHICTRIEHVAHVESVSSTIARALGLNTELTRAIATAHDIGHAPFGHQGEAVLKALTRKYLGYEIWHERNGVHFVDDIELLLNPQDFRQNLNLTYAVRDGIISHCGEVDHNCLRPREEYFDIMNEFQTPGQYNAVTWEGCVVKLADKIAYIGRDIEDADLLGYFTEKEKKILKDIAARCNENAVNTTVVTHSMIADVCINSSPEKGLCFSPEMHEILTEIKDFNYKKIYKNKRLKYYQDYSKLILESLFHYLKRCYKGKKTFETLEKEGMLHPFVKLFAEWLALYVHPNESYPDKINRLSDSAKNKKIYGNLETRTVYYQAVIDFIAGMTDKYAQSAFEELLRC